MIKKLILLTLLLGHSWAFAQQSSDAFNVTAYDDYFKVIAPIAWKHGTSMILQNKTHVTIFADVLSGPQKRKVATFSVKPEAFISIDLKLAKGESAVIVPLSPAFQEVVLEFGRRPYEIPPQR